MAVQFILGRSGTGKTSYCIKGVVDALLEAEGEQPLILLVPEQATYQAERAVLADERIAGYNRLSVLSFDRLQFLLMGRNTARPAISRIGQQMIIHRILRKNKSRLKIFGSSAAWPGLGRQMAQTIAELHQYAKTPDDIEQLVGKLGAEERNSLAVMKFADIGLVLKEYLEFIEGRFIDPDIQLTGACLAVAKAEFVKGAKLWVDGFAGFTDAELAVLSELLKVVADARIALCLDPSGIDLTNPSVETIDPVGLFSPTQRTYVALVDAIKKSRVRLAEPVILKDALRFSRCPPLAHIERDIFKIKPSKVSAGENVRVISAPSERAEVRFVARQILELVREKDYRYRDIAVIASDIGRYQHYVKAYFEDYGVPYFIDKRKPLSRHPVVQLVCSALQVVTGGFSLSDIFAYLKTDLVPVARYEVDLLENYCLAFGISAGDWQTEKQWHFAGEDDEQFDEQQINKIRLKVSGPLLELQNRLCPAGNPAKAVSAEEFTEVIFDLLRTLGVCERINEWCSEAADGGDYSAVDEHKQFYSRLVDIFDELVEVFGSERMSCEDYLAIINSAFSQLELAFIPPKLDQVLVGSIERSRHPDLKVVFLIGATQRQFPVPVSSGGVLSDDDRDVAGGVDFSLAPAVSQTLIERQYLAYIAFTRPCEFLCVTYPSVNEKGSAVARSQFIDELEGLFEDLGEESIADEQVDIEKVHNKAELADLFCSRLGRDVYLSKDGDNGRLGRLLGDVCSDKELAGLGSVVRSAISYDNRARLESETIERLFDKRIRSSATKLGTFSACPYRYFARYVLELKERKEFKFEPLDVGLFYHRVLDGLLKRLGAEGLDFATVDDEWLKKFLKEEISKLVTEDSFISNFAHRSGHNAFIIDSAGEYLEDCVLAIAQMVRAGSFRPSLSEVSFGQVEQAKDTLGKYELILSDGRVVSLDGKIDRLDFADVDGEQVAVVFDYKRGERGARFSWSKFYYGLDMQLPIYMLAVRNAAHSKTKSIAGAFYMPVEVGPAKTTFDKLSQKTDSFDYKAKGVFNGEFYQQLDSLDSNRFYNFFVTKKGDQYGYDNISGALRPVAFEEVLRFTEQKILELVKEILSGEIDIKPYRLGGQSPCSYCEYKSVCRFDWQINDYNPLISLGKSEVLEKMDIVDG